LFYFLILNKEMKKLVLLLAVVFSVSLFSCSNAEQTTENTDTLATEAPVEEVVPADTTAQDTAAQAAPAEAAAPADSAANAPA